MQGNSMYLKSYRKWKEGFVSDTDPAVPLFGHVRLLEALLLIYMRMQR
jgi:hypothetical protein